MSEPTRRTWRAGPATLTLMWIFTIAAGVVIPVLAYLIYRNDGSPWIPAGLGVLTLLALAYAGGSACIRGCGSTPRRSRWSIRSAATPSTGTTSP